MSIKQGDYLKKLRNEKGLSQEKLAERLGISRQSISKWEQGTATPDTENLLKLSNLYGVSADVILNCGEVPLEKGKAATEKENETEAHAGTAGGESPASNESPASASSPESTASEAEVTVSTSAGVKEEIHTASMQESEKREESAEEPRKKKRSWVYVAFPFFAVLAAAAVGALFNGWWYCWLILLLIPLFYTLVQAVERKNAVIFCYPVLVALIYFIFGFMYQIWHPLWLIFLTIPIYYVITVISHRNKKEKKSK